MSEKHTKPCDCFRPWKGQPKFCGQCGWSDVDHVVVTDSPKVVSLVSNEPPKVYPNGSADTLEAWLAKHPDYKPRPWDKRNL